MANASVSNHSSSPTSASSTSQIIDRSNVTGDSPEGKFLDSTVKIHSTVESTAQSGTSPNYPQSKTLASTTVHAQNVRNRISEHNGSQQVFEEIPLTKPTDKKPESEKDKFNDMVTYFYLSPTEIDFHEFQRLANNYTSNDNKDLIALMIGLIAQKHSWKVDESPLGFRASEIISGANDILDFVNNDNRGDPYRFDLLWGSYFATGDDQYLEKMLTFVGNTPNFFASVARITVESSANWSFRSNCEQHESIKQFALQKSKDENLPAYKRDFLHCAANNLPEPERPEPTCLIL
ncbi:hypothetical protein [Endozoicomonas ascidiicola]|uniref:hypothetical protein n=1 Tax=Endozoicomonas ascidiicola TaxID=1698521 RepID=UPI000830AEF8|nr:hypothetical protein [Endozoicomonas ascidiicola]